MPEEEFWNLRVREATEGDPGAFEHLLVNCHNSLLAEVRQAIPLDYERFIAPEDVLQDTFREALEALKRFRGNTFAEFWVWIRTIARREASDARDRVRTAKRGGGRHPMPWPDRDTDPVAGQLLNYLARNTKSPRSVAGDREYFGMIAAAMEELDPTQREAIRLRYVEQVPHADIGRRLGKSEDAVKMLCFRAIKHLRRMLPVGVYEQHPPQGPAAGNERL